MRNDHQIHEGVIGVNLTLSEYTSLYLDAGYFLQQYRGDFYDDEEGPSFNLSFSTKWERLNWRIDASGGYDADYFSSDDFGSSRFAKGLSRIDYQFTEKSVFLPPLIIVGMIITRKMSRRIGFALPVD